MTLTPQRMKGRATEMAVVEPQTFRKVMSSFPTGLTIITSCDLEGNPVGFTANAVTSVSMDPPMLLVCLSHNLFTLNVIERTKVFAVNFLESRQEDLAQRFASRCTDKFAELSYKTSELGVPLLDRTLAYAECEVFDLINAGDHTIALGLMVNGEAREGRPLMFFQRQYASWPTNGSSV